MSDDDDNKTDLREDIIHARRMAAEQREDQVKTHDGQISGSTVGKVTLGSTAGQVVQRRVLERAESERKRSTDTQFFLALLQQGQLDNWVAGEIAGSMTLEDFAALDAQLLAESGMDFLEHAALILGPDAIERRPGEDELTYRQRIMEAVADEVLEDNNNMSIKPGLEDNALAIWVFDHEVTQQAIEMTAEANDIGLVNGVDAATRHVSEVIESSYTGGAVIEEDAAIEGLADAGFDGANSHRDDDFDAQTTVERTAGFTDGFSGSGGALERASADLGIQFDNAAADPSGRIHQPGTNLETDWRPA